MNGNSFGADCLEQAQGFCLGKDDLGGAGFTASAILRKAANPQIRKSANPQIRKSAKFSQNCAPPRRFTGMISPGAISVEAASAQRLPRCSACREVRP